MADGTVRCIDSEIPFEIPASWEWCRMQNVIEFVNGRAYKKEELLHRGKYKVLRVGNFFTNNEWYYSDLELPEDKYCYDGDMLYAWSASFGPQIWHGDKTIFHYHIWNVKYNKVALLREYLYYFFLYDKTQVLSSTTGSTMIHVSMENMKPRFIPIPPYDEQLRIVEKVDRLIPIVSDYEKSQASLDELNNEVCVKLKSSILQEAIHGRLVPQIESEGTAEELLEEIRAEKKRLVKEGKLKKSAFANDSRIFRGDDNRYYEQIGSNTCDITNSVPFEIPDNWRWCRLRNIVEINPKVNGADEMDAAFVPMEAISPGFGSKFTFEKTKWSTIRKSYTNFQNGDVAFAKITPCFQNRKSVIFNGLPNGIGAGTTELKVLRTYRHTIISKYLLYFLQSPYFIDGATFKGTANQQRIVSGYLENILFPLPPLREQERIIIQTDLLFDSIK